MTNTPLPNRLGRDFFNRAAPLVARELLGKTLQLAGRRAIILETEAYMAKDDLAAHSVQGKKRALEALAKGPGTIYIHPMRGYVGIDLVAGDGSVLLRAINLPKADGPGKLTRELGITVALHTLNVADAGCPLALFNAPAWPHVVTGPRVGISKAVDMPLRFIAVQA